LCLTDPSHRPFSPTHPSDPSRRRTLPKHLVDAFRRRSAVFETRCVLEVLLSLPLLFLLLLLLRLLQRRKMSDLDLLERRLGDLEARVFGGGGGREAGFRPQREGGVIDAASGASDAIKSATKGHARIRDTYANLGELKALLDSGVADKKLQTEDLQLGVNLLLADEPRIRQISEQLDQIQSLNETALDSKAIRNVPELTERLNKLVEVTVDQQGDAQSVTRETEALLLRYNEVVNSLTRQFVSWDVIVTKLEIAAQTKEDEFL